MAFEKDTVVTKISGTAPQGQPRLMSDVVGHATDPFTGDRLVMVLWPGATEPAAYREDELAVVD
ncbi:hypothetical protein ACFCYF_23740 [Streptomyces chartreusis]|uniref:hypothetical protein n=1 Tax=Streptomyces chartreusis TaxID=1969 RepID=UPI0035D539FC